MMSSQRCSVPASVSESVLLGIKTKIPHAILHENPTQERRLQAILSRLALTERQRFLVYEQAKRTFLAQQVQKGRQWKREDEGRIMQMNLPSDHNRHLSLMNPTVLYHAPHYNMVSKKFVLRGPVIPVSEAVDESVNIIMSDSKVTVKRMERHIKTKKSLMKRHSDYCGKESLLTLGAGVDDVRFLKLKETLAPGGGLFDSVLLPRISRSEPHRAVDLPPENLVIRPTEKDMFSTLNPELQPSKVSVDRPALLHSIGRLRASSSSQYSPSLKKSVTVQLPAGSDKSTFV